MSKNKVLFRSFLSHPWKQAKYAFLIGLCFSVINVSTLLFINQKLKNHHWEHALDWNTISKMTLVLDDYMLDAALYGIVIGFTVAFGLMIYITHRFVGPYVSIKRFIDAHLKNENPPSLKVRQSDEIHEIVELINRLAQKKR
ncbi:MAG: hypothetical protein JNL11_14640 [Bdellovibrionaceae bacterium]|nr:hypothetical protein [Pseudobdellovibrionaceae bacterium]